MWSVAESNCIARLLLPRKELLLLVQETVKHVIMLFFLVAEGDCHNRMGQ